MRGFFRYVRQLAAGLRFRLLLLVLITSAPLAALTLHTAWKDRRAEMAKWQERAEDLLRRVQKEEQQILGATRQLLLAVSESAPVRSLDPDACNRLIADVYGSYPRYANLGIVTLDGEILAAAVPAHRRPNQAKATYFRRTLAAKGFSAPDFALDPDSGQPVIRFGGPVLNREGGVQAVVFAALDLKYFSRFGSEMAAYLPKGATWIEIDPRGRILGRYPRPDQWIGRTLGDAALVKAAFAGGGDLNQRRLKNYYAFASMKSGLTSGEVAGILSIPRQLLFAEANRALARNLLALAIAMLAALGLGWLGGRMLVLGPMRRLALSTRRLVAGSNGEERPLARARSQPDELAQLTLAVHRLSEALEQRESDRQQALAKLRQISSRLVQAQETERRHIARELHDEIGQNLTAAEMHLQAALRSPESGLERRLEAGIQAVERVLAQVHDMSLNLRPSMLDDLGLEAALRWYTARQAELAGLACRYQGADLEARLDSVVETECFRVAQEALTNVLRHARATCVEVKLRVDGGALRLSVKDDGIGFEAGELRKEAVKGASLGLLSMEERAALAGGGLEIISSPGTGTEIRAWFPLRWRPAEAAIEVYE